MSIKIGYALTDVDIEDGCFAVLAGSHKANLPLPFDASWLDLIEPLVEMTVPRGAAVLFTESLSRAIKPPDSETDGWLLYQYGTSYMVNWPGCDPSPELRARTADDPGERHLILEPYFHPAGAYRRKSSEE